MEFQDCIFLKMSKNLPFVDLFLFEFFKCEFHNGWLETMERDIDRSDWHYFFVGPKSCIKKVNSIEASVFMLM